MPVFYDEDVADHDLGLLYEGFDGIFGVVETDDAVYVGTIRNHPDTLSLTVETGNRGRPNIAEYADVQNLFEPGSDVDEISDAERTSWFGSSVV